MADATSANQGEQGVSETTRKKLEKQRVEFGDTIKEYFPTLFKLTVGIAASLILLIAAGFFAGRTMDATVLAASVQVAFGMVLGFVCIYIGLMMTWIGIDAAYSVKGDMGTGSFVLKSASPGLLFALGGMVLVSVALHKKIVYEENQWQKVGEQDLASEDSEEVRPTPPKNIHEMSQDERAAAEDQSSGIAPVPPVTFSGEAHFNFIKSPESGGSPSHVSHQSRESP